MTALDRQLAVRALRRVGDLLAGAPPVRLARLDLIAAKVFSGARRPQDVADLGDIRPSGADLDFVLAHLDRLEAEDLDRRTFDDQRAIVAALRGAP